MITWENDQIKNTFKELVIQCYPVFGFSTDHYFTRLSLDSCPCMIVVNVFTVYTSGFRAFHDRVNNIIVDIKRTSISKSITIMNHVSICQQILLNIQAMHLYIYDLFQNIPFQATTHFRTSTQGWIQGGGGVLGVKTPPFGGPPYFIKRGKNVAREHANGACFGT